jgi:hypothetical protein
VLELHAIANKKAEGGGEFAVAMTGIERRRFLKGMQGPDDLTVGTTVGSSPYFRMLGSVNAEKSQCSRPSDLESIFDGIRSSVGFEKLNRMVLGVMEEWMVGQLRAEVTASCDRGNDMDALVWKEALGRLLSELGRNEEALEIETQMMAYYKSKSKGGTDFGKDSVYIRMTCDSLADWCLV